MRKVRKSMLNKSPIQLATKGLTSYLYSSPAKSGKPPLRSKNNPHKSKSKSKARSRQQGNIDSNKVLQKLRVYLTPSKAPPDLRRRQTSDKKKNKHNVILSQDYSSTDRFESYCTMRGGFKSQTDIRYEKIFERVPNSNRGSDVRKQLMSSTEAQGVFNVSRFELTGQSREGLMSGGDQLDLGVRDARLYSETNDPGTFDAENGNDDALESIR